MGKDAQVFLLRDFLREYAPNAECGWPEEKQASRRGDHRRNNAKEQQQLVVERLVGTLVSPSKSLQPMSNSTSTAISSSGGNRTAAVSQEPLTTLVDDIIWSLVSSSNRSKSRKRKRGDYVPPNVLSRGYVVASEILEQDVSRCPNMRAGVVCKKLNGNASFCKTSRYFQTLHAMAGDDIVRMLLRRTSMFVPLDMTATNDDPGVDNNADGNDVAVGDGGTAVEGKKRQNVSLLQTNYMMLCGPLPKPAIGLLPASKPDEAYCDLPTSTTIIMDSGSSPPTTQNSRKRKRKRNNSKRQQQQEQQTGDDEAKVPDQQKQDQQHDWLGPNSPINRRSLFYSESYVPKVGFPKDHIFNIQNADQHGKKGTELLEHIFPIQTNTNKVNGRKRRKRWDRLKPLGPAMCDAIFVRHARTDYHRLLEKHCPLSKLVPKAKLEKEQTETRKKQGLPLMPELLSIPRRVQLSQVSTANTPSDAVVAFLSTVLRKVFPHSFWGSQHNFDRILELVDIFVNLRRHEDLPNKTIMKGIRITDIKWLAGNSLTCTAEGKQIPNRRLSRSSHEAATNLARYMLRWLFGGFVIPLLRSNFCVTESEFRGKRVLYYRKPVWSLFRSLSMNHLLSKQYSEISVLDVKKRLSNQHMGCSRLRLLPKTTGVRPIATLCKSVDIECDATGGTHQPETKKRASEPTSDEGFTATAKKQKMRHGGSQSVQRVPSNQSKASKADWEHHAQSTNDILRDSFEALKYEHSKDPRLFGAGVVGLHEFYGRYRQFISEVKNCEKSAQTDGKSAPKLHFASVDVHHCYDNIDQDQLLDIVVDILSEDDYMIHRYALVQSYQSVNRLFKIKKSEVGPPGLFDTLHKMKIPGTTVGNRGSVLVDEAGSTLTNKDNIMTLLREHLKSHLVVTRGRHNNRYLLQSNGIPQGSVLSGFLCNFYYGNMENDLLGEAFKALQAKRGHAHLLVRLIDDFLLITTDPVMHQSFLQTMYKGKPLLGMTINKEKMFSNQKVTIKDRARASVVIQDNLSKWNGLFPWCGMLFDAQNGEVKADYYRLADGKANDSLTVLRSAKKGEQLGNLMKGFMRPRCLPVLYDSFVNSRAAVEVNFFDLCILCATKTEDCLISSDIIKTATNNVDFLLSLIDDVILYSLQVIRDRLVPAGGNGSIAQAKRAKHLSKQLVLHLGWEAFRTVFQRSESLEALLPHVERKVKSASSRQKMPRQVLRSSQMTLILAS